MQQQRMQVSHNNQLTIGKLVVVSLGVGGGEGGHDISTVLMLLISDNYMRMGRK